MGFFGSRSRSHTGPNAQLIPTERASVAVTMPQVLVASRSSSQPSAAADGSSVSPRTCCAGPRSRSAPMRSGRPACCWSSRVRADTASRVPPNTMNPPTPAASAASILARSWSKLSRRQRSAGNTRRASDRERGAVTPA